ncbi:hypothetical protein F441_02425 [Phytophthora nicotianae CJ01A1]|uniref:Uncharacterized protein n=2 Tax=Phytophthora nicotianae TaxID=4792 RepID=W2HHM2_PHYNI|nr:hypothetical protein L915_02358 [Phytophthora nicotianae]ETL48030.1 hypothetical protein L916_02320 [Phytophthora nicotianae]ETP24616.1 hypothetical protein F441_02425 [Phytophthora nicotianae CJ01A1]
MATNLSQLCLTSWYGSMFSEDEIREIKDHDDESGPAKRCGWISGWQPDTHGLQTDKSGPKAVLERDCGR